jgi:hypothetical protein
LLGPATVTASPGPRWEFIRLSLVSSPGRFGVVAEETEMEGEEIEEAIGSPDLSEQIA